MWGVWEGGSPLQALYLEAPCQPPASNHHHTLFTIVFYNPPVEFSRTGNNLSLFFLLSQFPESSLCELGKFLL